ncbi:MAG: DUF167 domain-containing protein [Actinobacteria bacterium]|nr:DUF167 domain-containing protein [Actinomycetota bacterium]
MARIAVTVSPGARASRVAGRHGDGWKVRLAAPADRGRANEAVLELLAGALRVPRQAVRLATGGRARARSSR